MIFPYRLDLLFLRPPIFTYLLIVFSSWVLFETRDFENQYLAKSEAFCQENREIQEFLKNPNIPQFYKENYGEQVFHVSGDMNCGQKAALLFQKQKNFLNFVEHKFRQSRQKAHALQLNMRFQEFVGAHFFQKYAFDPLDFSLLKAFSSSFLHGDFFHLLFNMFYLWLFGAALELYLGFGKYFLLIVASAFGASLCHTAVTRLGYMDPLWSVGASGYLYGVFAVFLRLMPKINVKCFYWFIFFGGRFSIPAWILIGFYIVEQVMKFVSLNYGQVNVPAHIGGFIVGFFMAPYLGKRFA